MTTRAGVTACAAVVLYAVATSTAAQGRTAQQIIGHVMGPDRLAPTDERIAQLDLPPNFRITKFAEGLINPRMIAVGADGTVYVTRRNVGDVVMMKDTDGDGRADEFRTIASRPGMHGIAIDGQRAYLATVKDVYRTEIRRDGSFGELVRIIDDLPDGGQHANRTLAIGPDGMLYISVGSTCNACDETNPESATLLRATPDGSRRQIFASGLRNTIGFDWHPQTGQLFGMDHGIDWLGDEQPPEELNLLEEGKKYGWPYVYADGQVNPQNEPPVGITPHQWAAASEPPVLMYTAHAAPMQMAFYDGTQFPPEYRGDAFIAMRGSWNRQPPSGYEVVHVRFENGRPVAFVPFVTGFLIDEGHGQYGQLSRLAGLAVAKDGSLLIGDDDNGVIYRVSYDAPVAAADGPRAGSGTAEQPSGTATARVVPDSSGARKTPQLAAAVLRPRDSADLHLWSPAIAAGQPIPRIFSAYGQGISPPLRWSEGPEGTQTFAILLEDPDVPEDPPFVHWVAYNIPAEVRHLREGLPTKPRLPLPQGMMQGSNSYGSPGYYGMRPPAGDAPHRYHFQIFALDTTLDLPPGANREQVLESMRGHVLATGELVGTFENGR
ncbi:MAG TPA: YbhB/YbcL family Raf kinase inhibitor-like protein [Alphaproteobacteria bacterium]